MINSPAGRLHRWVARYMLPSMFLLALSSCSLIASEVDLKSAVIHHTASADVSANTIREWHVLERGWDDIGYHFVIRESGQIEKGRPITKKGAHAYGRNNFIGIALTGYDTFTPEQVRSLKRLLKELGIKHIERHHENCPGKGLDSEWDHLLQGGQDAKGSQTRNQGEKT
jgi:N-acetyl-anhydromuramyl-L-alanine amidase AmpD